MPRHSEGEWRDQSAQDDTAWTGNCQPVVGPLVVKGRLEPYQPMFWAVMRANFCSCSLMVKRLRYHSLRKVRKMASRSLHKACPIFRIAKSFQSVPKGHSNSVPT